MKNIKNVFINNKCVFAISDKDAFLEEIINQKKILIAMNAKKVTYNDPEFIEMVNNNIAYPDGSWVVKALEQKGFRSIKLAGHKLWLDIIQKTYQDKKIYIVGATVDVIEATVKKLKHNYPGINIVNYRDGYLSGNDIIVLKKDLQEKKPDIVFVAMGFPRQDAFMQELYNEHPALYMGLGGSFNVFTGKVSSVPDWWTRIMKSEALYRTIIDPKKLRNTGYELKFLLRYYLNKL